MPKQNISLIVRGAGMAASIWTYLDKEVRKRGGTDEDLHRLSTDDGEELIGKIADLIVGASRRMSFQRDMNKEGWTLVGDIGDAKLSLDQLELVLFLNKDSEQYVAGEVMCQRAKELGANLGQCQAEYLLRYQEDFPGEWRKYHLIFPGTVWRDPSGFLYVPYLGWRGVCWGLDFRWLMFEWFPNGRLLRLRR